MKPNTKDCAPKANYSNWNTIDWEKVERSVKSLQRRIAKAIREGKHGKAKSLQWILTHSFHAKLWAVKRVTENKGKRTPGVDKIRWKTPSHKLSAAKSLVRKGYKALPLRRLYILKKNGKKRPLGIPTMKDRAFQALHLLALEPISETLADKGSYGFRLFRSCHDALERCFIHLSRTDSATWILEGDIKGCFDNISHQWLIENIPMDKKILQQWLKAGFVENKQLFPTEQGTPQGGIISPTLANMTLDGLEKMLDNAFGIYLRADGCRKNNKHKIHLIRYADDFIVTADSKEILENKVKPLIEEFLTKRGLQLSQEKTKITHVTEGFDFLGQNIRMYAKNKLLVRPSKDSIKSVRAKLKDIVVKHRGSKAAVLIKNLNWLITGWANYHKHACSKRIFNSMDRFLWRNIWNWARRRHNKLSHTKIVSLLFMTIGNRKWQFFGKFSNGKTILLRMFALFRIKRHKLIAGAANPFDPVWDGYLRKRKLRRVLA
ncbi:group II intron reverse transcriptase/maturase [Marinilabilia salmonicolor]|uniref:group II intron reverse transcriptase/maturase n=1 Tax=Marinilabilia salmonicolor TaxID=989 RepID=UPI002159528E|nr:group II intron reverse transcriptase/maturase [Marinilabilia salmonicolor]